MKTPLLLLAALVPLMADSYYPRHNFTLGAGAGIPGSELTGLFNNSPGVAVGYGYRFHPNLQADAGVDVLFGAAGIRDFLPTTFGSLRIRDYQFLVPFGGRAILPLWGGRLLLSAGGGGTYMRYSELLRQPSDYFRIDCPVCASRSGWGSYALFATSVALDQGGHFRVGVTSKLYRGHTEGDSLGDVTQVRTRDRWVNVFGEFGFSF